jgi:hypothetical protein
VEVDALEDLRAHTRLERDRDPVEEALLGRVDGGVRGPVRVDEGGEVIDRVFGLNAKAAVSRKGERFEGDSRLGWHVNVDGEAGNLGSCGFLKG